MPRSQGLPSADADGEGEAADMLVKGRFRIEDKLDTGRFGIAYRAVDVYQSRPSEPRRVTLTALPRDVAGNPEALKLFLSNFVRVQKLAHTGIARVYDFDRDGDLVFITSEFVDGETLRNVVDSLAPERLATDEAERVIAAVGNALAYAHEHEVVHGDLVLENVIVTTNGRIKLIGLAAGNGMLRSGLPSEAAADVHDLAALAYELYVGRRPPPDRVIPRSRRLTRRQRNAIATGLAGGFGANLRALLDALGLDADRTETMQASRPAARRAEPREPVWKIAGAGVWLVAVAAGALVLLDSGPPLNADAERSTASSTLADRSGDVAHDAQVRAAAIARHDGEAPRSETTAGASDARAGLGAALTPAYDAPVSEHAAPVPAAPGARDAPSDGVHGARADAEPRDAESGVVDSGVVESADPASAWRLADERIRAIEAESAATVMLVRDGGTRDRVAIEWWTTDATATAADDYASLGKRRETIEAGATSFSVFVPIVSDAIAEPQEHFFVHVAIRPFDSAAKGRRAIRGARPLTATVIIDDDDR